MHQKLHCVPFCFPASALPEGLLDGEEPQSVIFFLIYHTQFTSVTVVQQKASLFTNSSHGICSLHVFLCVSSPSNIFSVQFSCHPYPLPDYFLECRLHGKVFSVLSVNSCVKANWSVAVRPFLCVPLLPLFPHLVFLHPLPLLLLLIRLISLPTRFFFFIIAELKKQKI